MARDLQRVFEAVRAGKPVVIVDDLDRENEGDLMVAAECANTENINFMIQHGRGLICVSLTEDRLRELELPRQVADNRSPFGTNFTVSIDHRSVAGDSEGATSRARTIQATVDCGSAAADFIRPGYVFPLGAVAGGVLRRRGQTEGSVDLSRLSGLKPAGVICEIMADDGTMLRGRELVDYCQYHNLEIVSIQEIVDYRLSHEVSLRRVARGVLPEIEFSEIHLPTDLKNELKSHVQVEVFVDDYSDDEHLAFVVGRPAEDCLVRIHSECLTGDVFQSRRCDCGFQLNNAFQVIATEGTGVVIYLYQEGRGIGLNNKLLAYELQDRGRDTVEANLELGFDADLRNYRVGAKILQSMGLNRVRLITNNPEKVSELKRFGIEVSERVPSHAPVDEYNRGYLLTKRERMGHLIP